jgi:restriction system protein
MTVPDFQTLMLPLLQIAGDGQEHSLSEAIDALAELFALSEDDRQELLPSGRQAKLDNRAGWASTYLRKAELLTSTGRGLFLITDEGLRLLSNPPERITIRFLERYPSFVQFRDASNRETETTVAIDEDTGQTPEEIFEAGYQQLRAQLLQELLEQVKSCTPRFFERLVVDLLLAMGYGGSRKDAGQAIGKSGDGGIDGIIKEDKLGLDAVYIQAKRWDENVIGRPLIQAFAGSLEGARARKGVFITTSTFSRDAYDYVERIEKKIVLIDGSELANLMIDHNIGVNEVASYTIKKTDLNYFANE